MTDTRSSPRFTLLTPTYNRASTLPRLYESILRQTRHDFEWLIIDDGSQDSTKKLVMDWQAENRRLIRYVDQPNAGKHVAFNRGVREAHGRLIAQIDSDDELLPDSLEILWHAWMAIPYAERTRFVGVTGLCISDDGTTVGDHFPTDFFVSDNLESRYKYRVRGEKWGFQRRDILLAFPFPEPAGLKSLPEGIVWAKIARRYKTLYVNKPVRIYHQDSGNQITRRSFRSVAPGLLLEYRAVLTDHIGYFLNRPSFFYRSAVHYGRAAFHLQLPLFRQTPGFSPGGRLLWLFALPLAWLVYLRDCRSEH